MPRNPDVHATKDDVKAIKADVKAVKDDVKAVKDDVKAVKDDVKAVKGDVKAVKGDVKAVKDELKVVNDRLAKAIVATQARSDRGFERLSRLMIDFRSEILRSIEVFAFRTVKVERDQILVIHRLDGLENRVTGLEARPR